MPVNEIFFFIHRKRVVFPSLEVDSVKAAGSSVLNSAHDAHVRKVSEKGGTSVFRFDLLQDYSSQKKWGNGLPPALVGAVLDGDSCSEGHLNNFHSIFRSEIVCIFLGNMEFCTVTTRIRNYVIEILPCIISLNSRLRLTQVCANLAVRLSTRLYVTTSHITTTFLNCECSGTSCRRSKYQ